MAGGSTSGVIPRPGDISTGRAGVANPPGRVTGPISPGPVGPGSGGPGSGGTGSVGVGAGAVGTGTGPVGVGRVTGSVGVGAVSGAVGAGRVSAAAAPVAPGRTATPDAPDERLETHPHLAPGLRPAAGSGTGPDDGTGGIRGARSELRRQMREKRRLRMITLTVLTLVVLLALPAFFGIRSASRDPVFTSLDALAVPAVVSNSVVDQTSGSRWCFLNCRFRERTAQSDKTPAETEKVYQAALRDAGWERWKVAQCPEQPVEGYSCWRRDEFTLDLWVRQPSCAVDAIAQQDAGIAPTEGVAPAPPDPKLCTGASVSIKVRNAITDERGRPEPQLDPSHVGETPDAVLTDNPLLETTPSPS
jgi:integrin beta 3